MIDIFEQIIEESKENEVLKRKPLIFKTKIVHFRNKNQIVTTADFSGAEADPRSKKIFADSIELMSKLVKLFDVGLRKVTIFGIMSPNLIISLYGYYTTDSGSSAFLLPFPMW